MDYTAARLNKKMGRGKVVDCSKCGRRGVYEEDVLPRGTITRVVHTDDVIGLGDFGFRSLRDFCSGATDGR